jgi:hypothetical protein
MVRLHRGRGGAGGGGDRQGGLRRRPAPPASDGAGRLRLLLWHTAAAPLPSIPMPPRPPTRRPRAGWGDVNLLAPRAELRFIVCGVSSMIESSRLSFLGEALRALLALEVGGAPGRGGGRLGQGKRAVAPGGGAAGAAGAGVGWRVAGRPCPRLRERRGEVQVGGGGRCRSGGSQEAAGTKQVVPVLHWTTEMTHIVRPSWGALDPPPPPPLALFSAQPPRTPLLVSLTR